MELYCETMRGPPNRIASQYSHPIVPVITLRYRSGIRVCSLSQALFCSTAREGFSLIDAPSFLKVVRKADLLLFSLKIKSLLGESKLSLPLAYRHSTLPSEELGLFLRLCLLDQSFPAFVEQVEKELRKIANE
ncbi:UNVERIFIED_CONTAM: hypothetical protein FKN15_002454 [Acipenser sinensis]